MSRGGTVRQHQRQTPSLRFRLMLTFALALAGTPALLFLLASLERWAEA